MASISLGDLLAAQGCGRNVTVWIAPILQLRGTSLGRQIGFAKKDRDNIERDELRAFRRLANELLALDSSVLTVAEKNGTITEIECHG